MHTLTEETDDSEKDEFYDQLERTCDAIAEKDVKIVLGDMNAKIGLEMTFRTNVRKHSLHQECNENHLRGSGMPKIFKTSKM